jgi:hypothetical protein
VGDHPRHGWGRPCGSRPRSCRFDAGHPKRRAPGHPRAPADVPAGGGRPRASGTRLEPGHAVHALRLDPCRVAAGVAPGIPLPGGEHELRHPADHRLGERRHVRSDGPPQEGEQRGRRGVHHRGAAGRRPLAGCVLAASAQFAGPGGPATITAEPDFAPHAQGLPTRNNLDKAWVAVPLLVIGLPLIAAPGRLLHRLAAQPRRAARRRRPRTGDHALALTPVSSGEARPGRPGA